MVDFKNVKAIFADSEGTIRDKNHFIKNETIEVIEDLKKINIPVIVTSGLPRFLVRKINKQAHGSPYIIASNGADIYDLEKEQNVYTYYLNHDLIKKLVSEYQNKFTFILGVGDFEYATDKSEYNSSLILLKQKDMENNFFQCHISQKKFNTQINAQNNNIIREIYQLKKMNFDESLRDIIDCDFEENLIKRIDSLNKNDLEILVRFKRFLELKKFEDDILKNYSDVVMVSNQSADFEKFCYTGETPWFSLNNRLVNKGNGIKKMCEYLHISSQNVLAIGNDYNDRTMIDDAGIFLCPTNSVQYILERSKNIYDENDIDKVLRKVYMDNYG